MNTVKNLPTDNYYQVKFKGSREQSYNASELFKLLKETESSEIPDLEKIVKIGDVKLRKHSYTLLNVASLVEMLSHKFDSVKETEDMVNNILKDDNYSSNSQSYERQMYDIHNVIRVTIKQLKKIKKDIDISLDFIEDAESIRNKIEEALKITRNTLFT